MSAAVEISQGYPVDGKPFEPPQQNRDNERPRYITFVGSVIEAPRITDKPRLRFGGMEIGNPCLRYVDYFIQKARITPVLKDVHDWVTADYWEKATGRDASYFARPIPPNYVAPLNETGHPSPIRPMYGKIAIPGQQMDSILNGSANILDRTRRGVMEITELAGHAYDPQPVGDGIVTDPTIWQIQRALFPAYPLILKDGQPTVLLDDIEELLVDAQQHTALRSIVDKYLASLYQFRDYAKGAIDQTNLRMRESAAKTEAGYIWRYTDLDFILMEQLGMQRQDREARRAAPTQDLGQLTSLIQQFVQATLEEKQLIAEQRKAGLEVNSPQVDANTMAAAPIAEPKPTTYICEHCNEEVKVAGKGLHTGRYCKVLHPKEVSDVRS